MALVPSGKVRLMVAQQMANDPTNNGAGAAATPPGTPAPRNQVEQEQIGGDASQQAADAPAPEGQAGLGDQTGVGEEGMPGETFDGNELSVQPVEGEDQQTMQPETTLKAYIFKVLEQLGIEPRMLRSMPDVFSQEIDFDTHTVSGHYYLPTHTRNKEVDERMAIQVAQRIGSQFGLSQKMKLEHKDGAANWRVNFTTQPKAQIQQSGTSFDVLKQHNPGGAQQQMARAAFTMGEMIKARRDDLYETMRKIAKGN